MSIHSVTSIMYLRIQKFLDQTIIVFTKSWIGHLEEWEKEKRLWRFADGLFAINWLDYHVEMNSSSPVPQLRWLPQTFHIGWRKSFSYLHRAVSESEDAPFADNVYSPPLLLKRTGKLMIGKDRSLVLSIEVTKGISKRQRPSLLQQIGVAFPLKCCPIRDAGAFKSAR